MKKIINLKILFALFLLIGFIGISAQQAQATHLRGVTLSWAPTGVAGEVEFRFLYSQRRTFSSPFPNVGTMVSAPITFGDGTSGNATGPVTSINTTEDYYIADLKIKKKYTGAGPYTAFYSVCCRISSLVNGRDQNMRLETIVRPFSGNSSPVSSILSIITLPSAPLVTFSIPASDADGDRLRFRPATVAEQGGTGNSQPPGLGTDPNTGLLTWNTMGLNVAPGTLYTIQAMVEDLDAGGNVKSKVPVDFIAKFVGDIGTAPTLTINPAGPLTVAANQPVSFTVTGTDGDANARVTLNAAGIPTGATMTPAIGAQLSPPVTSTFNWTPTLAQAGPTGNTYIINFTATDENNNQALKSITINVLPVGAPTANSQSISAAGGVPQNVILAATDPNGLAMTFSITGTPAHGTVALTGTPTCSTSGGISTCTQNATYTGTSGYSGPDLFTFRANNGVQNSNAANVSITVASNVAPVAQSQSVSTNEDTPLGITLGATDANGDALTYTIMNPSHGVLTGTAPNLIYTPNANYSGTDSFTFKAKDGTLESNTATVSITVNPVNDAPAAMGESYTTNEDTPINQAASGVLANDTDIDGPALSAVLDVAPANGTLSLNANGSFLYTPNANFNGTDSFTYHASDGSLSSNIATVSITVNAVNDAPTMGSISASPASLNENSSTTLGGSFTDPETADSHTVLINWGDGSADTTLNLAAGVNSFTANHQYLDDNPTGTSSDVYTVNITVTDNGGASATGGTQATVNNLAPGLDTGQVNLNLWTKEDFTPGSGTWTVQPGGSTVVQSINGQPTVFYSNQDFSGRFEGKIKVTTTNDDDFIGFVLGFNQGEMTAGSGPADYLLIDWKKGDQISGTVNGPKGLAVSRVNSRISTANVVQFWGHTGAVQQLARAATLGSTGWVTNTEYNFTFEYDGSRLRILVNGVEQFNLTAPAGNPFPVGRLGFYNYSQEQVVYSSFADDSVVGSEVSAVSVSKDFTDIGTLDTHTATINWGDGNISPATITGTSGNGTVTGSHIYADNGIYPVSITLTDDDGGSSSDTLTATIANVSPTASFTSNSPVIYGQTGNVSFADQTDSSAADLSAGLHYAYDFDNNGTFEIGNGTYAGSGAATSATIPVSFLTGSGIKTVRGRIIDKDGGFTDYTTDITVNKAEQTISFAPLAGKTYGDADFPISASASSNLPVSFAASGNCTVSGVTVHITGAGSCTITASQAGDANYNAAPDAAQTFAIAKAAPVISWTNPADITYGTALGGTQLNATASFQNSPLNGSFDYSPLAGAVLNAGANQTLSVNFTPTDAANFNAASATVSINVTKASLTVTADDKSKTYGGSPVAFTVSYVGFVNGDDSSDLGGSLAFNFADAANKPAGSHTITPSGFTSNNYDITFQNGTLNVSKAPLTVTADDASKIYGGANPAFTAQYSGFVLGEGLSDLGGSLVFNTAADQTSAVGNYAVTPAGLTSGNYDVSFVAGTLAVTPAALTVKTDDASKIYGAAPVAFSVSYTGFVNSDTASSLGGTLAFDFADAANTAAGSYTVTPSGLTSANYNIAFNGGTFTVSKAALTVVADSFSRTYGAANPSLTGTISGIQNGDAITASYATEANATSAVATYAIVPALSGATLSNYDVTATTGALTITKAPQTIEWNNPANIVYGTSLGAAQLNAIVRVIGPAAHGAVSYTPGAGTILNAGNNQTLSVSVAGTNNYEPASASVVINVAKAPSVINVSAPAFIAQGGSVTISGVLTGVANAPLGNQPVTLSIGSGANAQSCATTTAASGAASCTVGGINQPLGPNLPVNSAFAGNSNYLSSSAASTTLVFAYAVGNGGSFVIGDNNSAVGQGVTFWGSQWANVNSLSGGAAPNGFKGFANRSTTAPASCGATWTTDPGNSSNPPAAIPAYMAVIVSNSITKSGSTISGNTPKVVIVRTNAGYGSSPGQTGTGTVVGVLCQ